jgi:hypothetical protein
MLLDYLSLPFRSLLTTAQSDFLMDCLEQPYLREPITSIIVRACGASYRYCSRASRAMLCSCVRRVSERASVSE